MPISVMSQRTSPFRRTASPGSPTAYRSGTPPSTSRGQASPLSSPSKLKHSYTASEDEEDESMIATPTTTLPLAPSSPTPSHRQLPSRPTNPDIMSYRLPPDTTPSDVLSRLPPALLASLRESFAVLDSAGTGTIDTQSVRKTLTSLGLSTNDMSQLFPAGQPQQITLPTYLNSMASMLVNLSPPQELLNAFSAFDDDESGQIDVAELRNAVLNTPAEPGEQQLTERDVDDVLRGFTGRRMLGRGTMSMAGVRGMPGVSASRKGGDVFRYREFVSGLSGGAAAGQDVGHNQTAARTAVAR